VVLATGPIRRTHRWVFFFFPAVRCGRAPGAGLAAGAGLLPGLAPVVLERFGLAPAAGVDLAFVAPPLVAPFAVPLAADPLGVEPLGAEPLDAPDPLLSAIFVGSITGRFDAFGRAPGLGVENLACSLTSSTTSAAAALFRSCSVCATFS